MEQRTSTRLAAFVLAFALLLTSCGGGGVSAATMHLRKTEGTVGVSDNEGKDVAPADNLGLYSGYQVGTQAESYAWIDLDSVKLTKMDANSEVEITKDGKKLEIEVKSGSLFFNVTEPLKDDETMTIRSATLAVGIRGTCGWVEVPDNETLKVFLLEGKVRCEVDGEHENVRAGEMAVLTRDGNIIVSAFTASDIPDFVMEEIEDDNDLVEAILDDSGIDPTETDPMAAYEDVLSRIGGERLCQEFFDFEGDGNPELLLIAGNSSDGIGVFVLGNRPDGCVSLLGIGGSSYGRGTLSLVESNDKLFLRYYNNYSTEHHSYDSNVFNRVMELYFGSVAQSDGGQKEWGTVDKCEFGFDEPHGNFSYVNIRSHEENGLVYPESEVNEEDLYDYSGKDPAELEAIQSKYTHVRDLITYDGSNITVVEP